MGHIAQPCRQGFDQFALLSNHSQTDGRMFQDQLFEIGFFKTAGIGGFQAPCRYGIMGRLAEYILSKGIAGFSIIEGYLAAVFKDFAQFDPPRFDKKHGVSGIPLAEHCIALAIRFPSAHAAQDRQIFGF